MSKRLAVQVACVPVGWVVLGLGHNSIALSLFSFPMGMDASRLLPVDP